MAHSTGYSVENLRNGTWLGTIAHAIWVARRPLLAGAQSWDGANYLLDDASGTLAAITFGEAGLVGTFFDAKSPRSPFVSKQDYDIARYVKDMPKALQTLAQNEALQYMLQEYRGVTQPIVTATIWSDTGAVLASEPWTDVLEHGGHVLRIQVRSDEAALAAWRDELELAPEQIDLARALYQRKLAHASERIALTEAERRALASTTGEEQAREILAHIGIDL